MPIPVCCPNSQCARDFYLPDTLQNSRIPCPYCRRPVIVARARTDAQGTKTAQGSVQTQAVPSPDERVLPPQEESLVIAGFKLAQLLGRGTFGAVYKAWDPELNRDIALKLPTPQTLQSDNARERFLREARAAAQLRHPHIVPVFKAGQDGDQHYIASAYIKGQSLAVAVSGKPLGFERTARIIQKLADALDYAHRHGIVHRDIKPENVMLDERDEPQLMDFGIARVDAAEERFTQDGHLLGTPAYMSPEQASGKQNTVGPASDQYSLGVALYELLTGKLPFSGPTQVVVTNVLNHDPDPVQKLNAQVPRDLAVICEKAMSKDPRQRYESCAAMGEDLRRYLNDEPIAARPLNKLQRLLRWSRRNRQLAASLAVISVLLLALGIGGPLLAARQAVLRKNETTAREAEAEQRQIAEQRMRDVEQARNEAELSRKEAEKQSKIANDRLGKANELISEMLFDVDKQLREIPQASTIRRDLIDRTGKLLDALLVESGDDPATLRLNSVQNNTRGDIALEYEDPAAARKFYESSYEIRKKLLADNPQSVEAIRDFAIACDRMGNVTEVMRDLKAAREFHQESLKLSQKLLTLEPDTAQARRDVGVSLSKLGDISGMEGDREAALDYYQQALEIDKKLVAEYPNSAVVQRNLLVSYNKLGDISRSKSEYSEAQKYYELSLAISRKLVASDEDSPARQRDLSHGYDRLGDVFMKTKEYEKARQHYQQSLEIRRQLVRANPASAQAQQDLWIACEMMADALLALNDKPEAIDYLEQAIAALDLMIDRGQYVEKSRNSRTRLLKKIVAAGK